MSKGSDLSAQPCRFLAGVDLTSYLTSLNLRLLIYGVK